jgi:hypothetical protein
MTLYVPDGSAWPTSYTIPDDGDPITALSVNIALEALGDKAQWLKDHSPRMKEYFFSTPGTYNFVVPPRVQKLLLIGAGGGGGGGKGARGGYGGTDAHACGGGGGGGALLGVYTYGVTPGGTYPIEIPALARGGGASGNPSFDGEDGGAAAFNLPAGLAGLYWRGAAGGKSPATGLVGNLYASLVNGDTMLYVHGGGPMTVAPRWGFGLNHDRESRIFVANGLLASSAASLGFVLPPQHGGHGRIYGDGSGVVPVARTGLDGAGGPLGTAGGVAGAAGADAGSHRGGASGGGGGAGPVGALFGAGGTGGAGGAGHATAASGPGVAGGGGGTLAVGGGGGGGGGSTGSASSADASFGGNGGPGGTAFVLVICVEDD